MYLKCDIINILKKKANRIKDINKKDTMISSIIAGIFISFGAFLMLSVGSFFIDSPLKIIVMASVFSIALMLIVFLGGDLFTGHCMFQTNSLVDKDIKISNFVKSLTWIWIGNLVGALISSFLFYETIPSQNFMYLAGNVALSKVSISVLPLFIKGIFCNIFVCLAILLSIKNDSNPLFKMFIIWWCIFAFIICGFEHSIANMSLLTFGYLSASISISDALYNLSIVTLGNILGGGLLGYIYMKYL